MMEDINNYIIEGQTYIAAGTITPQESGKMEKEIRYNIYRLSGTADSLTTQRL